MHDLLRFAVALPAGALAGYMWLLGAYYPRTPAYLSVISAVIGVSFALFVTTGPSLGSWDVAPKDMLSGVVGAVLGAMAAILAAILVRRSDRGLSEEQARRQANQAGRLITIELRHNLNLLEAFRQSHVEIHSLTVQSAWNGYGVFLGTTLLPDELTKVGLAQLYVASLQAVVSRYVAVNNVAGFFADADAVALLGDTIDRVGSVIPIIGRKVWTAAEWAAFESAVEAEG